MGQDTHRGRGLPHRIASNIAKLSGASRLALRGPAHRSAGSLRRPVPLRLTRVMARLAHPIRFCCKLAALAYIVAMRLRWALSFMAELLVWCAYQKSDLPAGPANGQFR
jgi:hypothetical protein